MDMTNACEYFLLCTPPEIIVPKVNFMYFEQFYLGCLAHASYLLGSEGEGIVVDPQRDVEIYLEAAQKNGLTIRYIFETHLHADFVSGHRELAERTGANIYLSRAAGATFPHVAVDDGYKLQVGKLRLEVLATPGHTPESISLLVTDEEKGAAAVGGADRRYAVHRRRGASGPVGHAHASATCGPDVRLAAWQANDATRRRDGVSGARGGVAVRTQHAGGAVLHHRHRAAHELRAAD